MKHKMSFLLGDGVIIFMFCLCQGFRRALNQVLELFPRTVSQMIYCLKASRWLNVSLVWHRAITHQKVQQNLSVFGEPEEYTEMFCIWIIKVKMLHFWSWRVQEASHLFQAWSCESVACLHPSPSAVRLHSLSHHVTAALKITLSPTHMMSAI